MSGSGDIALSRRPMAAFVAVGIAWGSFAALVPPVKAQIGASDGLYGGLMLVASLGALAAMWLAPLAYRVAGRWAMVLGALAIGLGFGLAGMAAGPVWFACAMLLAAAGSGVADVLGNAEIAESESKSGRSLMNLNHAIYSFAFAAAALTSGALRDAGVAPTVILWLLCAAIAGLCLLMLTRAQVAEPGREPEAETRGLPVLLVWLGGGVVLSAFLTEAATEGWAALHVERTLGGGAEAGALGPALFAIMMGIGRLSGHALVRRVPELQMMGAACLVAAAGLVMAGAAPVVWVALMGFALTGLGIAVVVPLALALVGRFAPAHVRLAAISRAAALGYAAFFLGPPVMGGVAELLGLRAAFWVIAGVLVAVSFFLVPALARQIRAVAGPR